MKAKTDIALLSTKNIGGLIYTIQGLRVLIASDLAKIYQVETKGLMRAVYRNQERFPKDFMFKLTREEALRVQNYEEERKASWGGSRKEVFAFTEHGVLMLSSVLKSKRAIQANIEIMRAFITLRQFALTNQELAQKITQLEGRYDGQFKVVFNSIRELMLPTTRSKRRLIGFDRV